MEKPRGFVAQGESSTMVCQLHRSLYRLKQSPRAWFGRFHTVVQQFGMFHSEAYHSIFYCHSTKGCIYLIVYVDDIRKYALDILEETSLLNSKFVDTPMDLNIQEIGGEKLNYLIVTWPYVSFAINVVSQFMHSPCQDHWDAMVRILKYIKNSLGKGLIYEDKGHAQIVGYSDADCTCSPTNRRSTSRYCVLIKGNLISWKSKKQNVVARSSAEVECNVMAIVTCELIWLKRLLREL
ncbi:hypothetical protein CR513_37595, partial [Mucuna pruriens]